MRRLLAFLRDHEPGMVVAWVLSTLGLGVVGLRDYLGDPLFGASDLLYQSVQLFVLQLQVLPGRTPWTLDVARWSSAAVSFYAVLRAGSVLFAGELERLRLRRLSGHVVVCGLGRKGHQLAQDLLSRGERVVIIEKDEENDSLLAARESGALVLLSAAADEAILRQARVAQAALLFAVTGDDGANIETALAARRLVREQAPGRTTPLRVLAHVGDLQLCGLIRASKVLTGPEPVEAQPFNIHEAAARVLLRDHPLDRERVGPGDPRFVHLCVVGFGQMGESVALQAARLTHLANGSRLRVTIVDRKAEERRQRFLGRCPGFTEVADLDVLEGDVEYAEVLTRLEAWGQDPHRLLDIVVCFDDDRRGLACGLTLVERLRGRRVPVRVRMSHEAGMSALVQGAGEGRWNGRISVFGMIDRLCNRESILGETLDLLARTAHTDYLRRKLAEGEVLGARASLREWPELDEFFRESNRQQADHIPVKLRAVGCGLEPASSSTEGFAFTPDEVELLARMEHDRWCARYLLDGWRKGPRDDVAKTHPCIVPWAELEETYRDNDRAAIRQIPELLALIGQRLVREDSEEARPRRAG
ncbi:MAG TPA: NAD-binding protein [Archangium sp.]|uniref:NAD-binding protein n=1 Tax=Archangium sp. TaxID=1872627 RepID=UPI002E37B962|nr:NAD-binding protein [Archangium sp.]HEX5746461.1 NAD-binding protein [Archangium sp.]